nr:lytic transglycosylase domain-containing protein [Acuticoccus mangrovi]
MIAPPPVAAAGASVATLASTGGSIAEVTVATTEDPAEAVPEASGTPRDGTEDATDAAGEATEDAVGASAEDEPAEAEREKTEEDAAKAAETAELCRLLVTAADRYRVPHDFFIRLIWKESRFNAGAVSPMGAEGIAQFMPGTARIRGLANPFDRREALFASAHFLADLKQRFGSWGLAAAGYNGGPNRVPPFVAGDGGLPYETIDYVFSITGRSAHYWALRARRAATRAAEAAVLEARWEADVLGSMGSLGGAAPAAIPTPLERPAATSTTAERPAATSTTAERPAATLTTAERPAATPLTAKRPAATPVTTEPSAALEVEAVEGSSGADATAAPPAAEDDGSATAEPVEVAAAAGDVISDAESVATEMPTPQPRPDYQAEIDCPTLIARLGRQRSVAPPADTAGGWTPWGAQVAGHPNRTIAMRQYARLKPRLPGDLVAKGPHVVLRRFAARGRRPIHAVQFGATNRAEAQALCKRISAALAPCVVVRNS